MKHPVKAKYLSAVGASSTAGAHKLRVYRAKPNGLPGYN
jgi:hypothetical protein